MSVLFVCIAGIQSHRHLFRRMSHDGAFIFHVGSKRQVSNVVATKQSLRFGAEESGIQVQLVTVHRYRSKELVVLFFIFTCCHIKSGCIEFPAGVIFQFIRIIVIPTQIVHEFITIFYFIRFARFDFSTDLVLVQPTGMLELVVGIHVRAGRLANPAKTDLVANGSVICTIKFIIRPPSVIQKLVCPIQSLNPLSFRGSFIAAFVGSDYESRSYLHQFAIDALLLGSGLKIIIGTSPKGQGQCQCC